MKKLFALLLALVMVLTLVACSNNTPSTPSTETSAEPTVADKITAAKANPVKTAKVKEAADAGKLKIGVILVGDENEGYTFAHIDGVEQMKKALNISDDQVIYKYNIPENETCYDTACDLVEQGCQMIFSNSFSHESYMVQAAAKYPDVVFLPATGNQAAVCGLPNVVNYFTSVYESRYVSGIVAGMKIAELVADGKLNASNYDADGNVKVGYVGAYPYAEVVSGYTAFFLGVRSVYEKVSMEVTFTNSWFSLTAEAEAANSLISRGCVIIGQHADSTGAPSAVQAAHDAGTVVYSVGYNIDMLGVAPDVALTSAQNCWGELYTAIVRKAINGEDVAKDNTVSYKENGVKISPLGSACAAGTAEAVDAAIAKLKNGELHVFDINTFTVGGQKVESFNTCWGFEGIETIWDGYFHESEIIAAPLFELAIDGITKLN